MGTRRRQTAGAEHGGGGGREVRLGGQAGPGHAGLCRLQRGTCLPFPSRAGKQEGLAGHVLEGPAGLQRGVCRRSPAAAVTVVVLRLRTSPRRFENDPGIRQKLLGKWPSIHRTGPSGRSWPAGCWPRSPDMDTEPSRPWLDQGRPA